MGIISRGKGKGRKTRKEYLQFLAIARENRKITWEEDIW